MKIEDLKKFDSENEWDYFYNKEIKCPYCNNEFRNDIECIEIEQDNYDIVECGNCGKSFYVQVEIEVNYSSTPLENELIFKYKYLEERILNCQNSTNEFMYENELEVLKNEMNELKKLFEEHKEQFESEKEND